MQEANENFYWKSYFVASESNPAHARNRIEFSKSSRAKWRDPLGAAKFGLAALHQRFGKQGSKKVATNQTDELLCRLILLQ